METLEILAEAIVEEARCDGSETCWYIDDTDEERLIDAIADAIEDIGLFVAHGARHYYDIASAQLSYYLDSIGCDSEEATVEDVARWTLEAAIDAAYHNRRNSEFNLHISDGYKFTLL